MVSTKGEMATRFHAGFVNAAHPVAMGLLAITVLFIVLFWPSIAWVIGEWSSSSGWY